MTDTNQSQHWQHDHAFGQDVKMPGEQRTLVVIAITVVTMVVEIVAGLVFGSMALLADGLHMGSHAAALGIAAFAYIYARRRARDRRFSFGTGKMNALGGFCGATLLAAFAVIMAAESVHRLLRPVNIEFDLAILVACLGLAVNGASAWILKHEPSKQPRATDDGGQPKIQPPGSDHLDHDHNLHAAYLHVLADALTSVLAITALLAGKYYHAVWMDPTVGILGALLVARWSWGLVRATSSVLLDREGPQSIRDAVIAAIQQDEQVRVVDFHLWSIGPNIYGLIVSVVSPQPRPAEYYKRQIPGGLGLAHVTIEVLTDSASETSESSPQTGIRAP